MMYLPGTAYQPKEAIKQLQEKKLQELVHYLEQHSPFYKELFVSANVKAADIKTLEDLRKIPTTTT